MSPVGSAGSGKARWACWPDRRPNWFDSAKNKCLGLPLFSIRADLLTVLDSELPAWQGEQIFLRMNSTSSRWKATSAAADRDPRSENIVRVRTHQSDGTNDDNENHRQHHRILRDILGFLTDTGFPKNVNHIPPPVGNSRTTSDSGGVRDSGKNSD